MLYQRHTFTLPASNSASQIKWDLAFLSSEEFSKKYGISVATAVAALEVEEPLLPMEFTNGGIVQE